MLTISRGTPSTVLEARLLEPATFAVVCNRWASDREFREQWIAALAGLPFEAYCWEAPPLTTRTMGREFHCVFVDSPGLGTPRADPQPFAEHFARAPEGGVVVFQSLGKDAALIAPCPGNEDVDYAHLAVFTRSGTAVQNHALWEAVGTAAIERIGNNPTWLSTSGFGVAWLHVRLDTRPKYYRYRPYTDPNYQ